MSYLKTTLCLAVVAGLGACTAASQQSPTLEAVSKKTAPVAATVKPGASVTLNSALPKSMISGSFQAVQLSFNEAYNDGTLSVTIEPSAGLKLFGGTSSKTFDMTNPGAHVWDLDVKADADGVYFLNIFADAYGQSRSFSVRLDVGQVTQKMFDDAMPNIGELTDGGKIRVLDAEETIK